jgi:cell division protein ZapA (FtsZ GTPase activity inhibitor)
MSSAERLTENIRVRVTASEKAELEAAAAAVDRKPAALARRAIRAELDRIRAATKREV